LAFIWPFFIFQDLAFFETAYGQIWPFNFFWTWHGNPGEKTLVNQFKMFIGILTQKQDLEDYYSFDSSFSFSRSLSQTFIQQLLDIC
jgi:hypothetical protein